MSPRAAVRRAGAAACALLLAGCASVWITDGHLSDEPLRIVRARVEDARGIAFERDVATRVIDAADVPALVRRVVARERSPEELAAEQESLVTLGLWPADRNLLESFADVAREEIAGVYVAREQALYVVRDPRMSHGLRLSSFFTGANRLLQFAITHELVHAQQHQHWPDLFTLDDVLIAHADAAAALQAALEGDATLFGMLATGVDPPSPSIASAAMEDSVAERTQGALADAPALVRLSLAFPYARGYALSFREASALLDDPPASTEQVMHPERRRAPFEAIDLAGARDLLPADCRVTDENTVGELALSILLRDLTPNAVVSPAAWEGWDGDRALTAHCGGRREFVWLLQWDETRDAEEFESAYRVIAPAVRARAGLSGEPVVLRHGRALAIASPGLAAVAPAIANAARRDRVATLGALCAHFGTSPPPTPGDSQRGRRAR